ncbi:MAG: hypothetical protein IPO28_08215 [Holophagaceae bacterium]|nr:hypothetical protein [Holophagaceae bacterium]
MVLSDSMVSRNHLRMELRVDI